MTNWMIASADRDGRRIGEVTRARWDAPVRACPGWTGADLLSHMAGFARYVPALVHGEVAHGAVPVVAPADAAASWDDDLDGLLDVLGTTPPDAPLPNWSVAPDVAAFWIRRAAQEFAVHRWDADTTAPGEPDAIPVDVALDGIAEYFAVFAATGIAAGMTPAAAATVVLEPTDGPRSEHHLPDPGPVTVLRGTASDLLLALWRRRDPVEHLVSGDRALLEAWPRI